MGLWVLLVIRCSTFTFLSDVGHITHTSTQQQNGYSKHSIETKFSNKVNTFAKTSLNKMKT